MYNCACRVVLRGKVELFRWRGAALSMRARCMGLAGHPRALQDPSHVTDTCFLFFDLHYILLDVHGSARYTRS